MPIGNYCRFIAAALILLNLAIPNACAESPLVLDEGKALELFEKASKSLKAADAQAISARMAENAAVLPANPNFMFDGDNPGSGSREYTAVFEWTTDISGRKGFLRKSAASMRMSTESVVQAKKIDVLIGFKRVFYDARRVEELARATREMASKIKALSNIVRTASRQSEYDRLRLESEFAKAEIAAKSSSEEIALRHCELASLMGLPECGDIELTGEILPSSTTTTGITNINNHPAITKLMSELDRKSFEQKAAERRAIPGIGFKGGIKNLEGVGTGPYAGIALSLPIFDTGRAEVSLRKSEINETSALLEAERLRLSVEAATAFKRLEKNSRNADRYRNSVLPQTEKLERTAAVHYTEGRIGITELIDAFRTAFQAKLEFLDITYAARTAEIDFAYSIGQWTSIP